MTSILKKSSSFILLLGVIFLIWNFKSYFNSCSELRDAITSKAWMGAGFFLTVSTLAMMILIPRTLPVIVAGICFGTLGGSVLVLFSSIAAATFSFLIARHLARRRFEKIMSQKEWFRKFEKMTQSSGFSFIVLMRANQIFHYGLTSYASGLLPIRLGPYILGTFIGIFPGTIALVFGGSTLGCSLLEGKANLPIEMQQKLVIATVLLTLFSALPLYKHWKK